MVDTQTSKRADALKATGDIARTAVENMMKEAVAEAMREVEDEQRSTSNRRRIPAAVLLLGIGAIIGFALASRRERDSFDTNAGIGRQTEDQPTSETTVGSTEMGETGAAGSEADEEQADATSSD